MGIRLNDDDYVVAMDIIDDNRYLLVVSENGYGKKTNIDKYKVQNRGGKGVKTYKISKRTGDLISARLVNLEDEIILMSAKGDIIRLSVRQVSTKGRDTMGVKIRDVQSEDDKIVAVTKYIEDIED